MTYVPVSRDSSLVPFGRDTALARAADEEAWLARLRAAGSTHVMSFVPASVELAWMASRPDRFRRLAGGAEWGLYQVLPGESE